MGLGELAWGGGGEKEVSLLVSARHECCLVGLMDLCLGLACCGGGRGFFSGSGLEGLEAQVQLLLDKKYGIAFSGNHVSSALHFCKKTGQVGEVLGCCEPGPQDTHDDCLLQVSILWNLLVQLAHFSMPMHKS